MGSLYSDRIEADYLNKIEIYRLKLYGLLKPGYHGAEMIWKREGVVVDAISLAISIAIGPDYVNENFVCFRYTQGSQKYDYRVKLETTYCNYGGHRYWFCCPLCNKRIGVVYLRGEYFACRHCNYLTYESNNLSGMEKGMGRIISVPELEAIEKKVKRINYNGKPTRTYLRYLRTEQKFRFAFASRVKASMKRSQGLLGKSHSA